eukprot:m51a1_g9792 putative domain-containing protein (854) ;mRNA; f:1757168-1760762
MTESLDKHSLLAQLGAAHSSASDSPSISVEGLEDLSAAVQSLSSPPPAPALTLEQPGDSVVGLDATDEAARKAKVAQMREVISASIADLQRRAASFRRDIAALTTEDQICELKEVLKAVIDGCKMLGDFPAGERYTAMAAGQDQAEPLGAAHSSASDSPSISVEGLEDLSAAVQSLSSPPPAPALTLEQPGDSVVGLDATDEAARKAKVAQMREVISASIADLQRRAASFRRDIAALTTEDQICELKEVLKAVIDGCKMLGDFPAGERYTAMAAGQDQAEPVPPRVEAFRKTMDLICWELLSKLAILEPYAQAVELITKAITLSVLLRNVHKALDRIQFIEDPSLDREIAAYRAEYKEVSQKIHDLNRGTINRAIARQIPAVRDAIREQRPDVYRLMSAERVAEEAPSAAPSTTLSGSLAPGQLSPARVASPSVLSPSVMPRSAANALGSASLGVPKGKGGSVAHSLSNKAIQATLSEFVKGRGGFCPYEEDAAVNEPGSGVASCKSHRVELGSRSLQAPPRPLLLLEQDVFKLPYWELFFGRDHWNFVAKAFDAKEGPCVLSLIAARKGDEHHCTVLARQKKGDRVVTFKEARRGEATPQELVRAFRRQFPVYSLYNFQLILQHELELALSDFEVRQHISHFKFGVLYGADGQGSVEDDLYNNKTGSEEYEDFLSLLGTRIDIVGWQGYRGGLDTNSGATGTQSLYTDWRGFEIMFHVSTMLPYMAGCEQQVERKRHLGNDIVLLVWMDGSTPFDPTCIRSQFNHVYVVVRPDRATGPGTYKVSVIMREEVQLFPPYFPRDFTFTRGDYFREFILAKLVNAELSAYRSPSFSQKNGLTRKETLQGICDKYYP